MVGMARNKQTFWYALYDHSEPIYDKYGNETGEKAVYGNPIMCRANVSASRGTTAEDLFGINAEYTKTINPLPLNCPIDETSILWVDKAPVIEEDGSTKTGYDYKVTQVAESLNHKAYAIFKVDVADTPTEAEAAPDDESD